MNVLSKILCLERPVYWLLPEAYGRKGFPHETLILGDAEDMKDLGYGVFFCPNELGDVKNEKGNLRHESNVTRFTSVFVDMDKGTENEQRQRLMSYPLPPTAIVRTGRGHHAYWVLDRFQPIDPHAWQRVQKVLAQTLYGDPACNDPARLMRLPDTWHVKHEPKPVSIVHLNEQWMYTLDEFPGATDQPKKIFYLPPQSPGRRIIRAPRAPTVTSLEEGGRHAALVKECARYLRGVAPSEILYRTDDLKAWYAQSSRPLKKNWEAEVTDVIEWVLKKELGNFNL